MASTTRIKHHITEIGIKYQIPDYQIEPIIAIIEAQQTEVKEARERALAWRRQYIDVKERVKEALREPKIKRKSTTLKD